MRTARQKLKQIVENAVGDDLERARASFRGMSDKELDEQHGQSGMTRRQVLEGYETERKSYLAAKNLAETLYR